MGAENTYSDQIFLDLFLEQKLPKEDFTHLAHLRLVYLLKNECQSIDLLEDSVCQALLSYASSIGAAHIFQEPLTRLATRLIAEKSQGYQHFSEFITAYPSLVSHFKTWVDRYAKRPPSVHVVRTDASHPDFKRLILDLDIDLKSRYGPMQAIFDEFNSTEDIKSVILVYDKDIPVACGSFKEFSSDTVELKRMFVAKSHRRLGLAQSIIFELEAWALALGYESMLLETAYLQHEAIALYQHYGFEIIENYPPYQNLKESICMKKKLAL